ncbi:hypothetical protein [Paenibacillus sp. HB172176]|uniref:hypothetical protein n=1 Tax=Paenibacillus sp. HB172176 TaxID=2493690 RepID=UPI00143B4AF3|nr:hypothetical protein [Paenibacillus sp. HB172176]
MFRGLTWLAKLIAAGLIISFLSIWTTGYIVTSYVESILKQFELPVEVPPIAMSGVWGKLWGSEPLLVDEGGATASETAGLDDAGETDQDEAESEGLSVDSGSDNSSHPSDSSQEDSSVSEDEGMPNATEVFGNVDDGPITDMGASGGSAAGSGQDLDGTGSDEGSVDGAIGTEVAITEEGVTDAKEKMSDEDKSKLLELLMTELPQETWQQISSYMEDGLTDDELLDVQQLMAQYLDEGQYNEMMGILKKY